MFRSVKRPASLRRRGVANTRFRPSIGLLEERQLMSVTYRGGPLIGSAQVENLFLGSSWASSQSSEATRLDGFVNYITSSSYFDTLGQYDVGHGQFAGEIRDTSPPSSTSISDAQIQQIILQEVHGGVLSPTTPNTVFLVFLPKNFTSLTDEALGAAGHHYYFVDPANGKPIYYAVIPDQTDAKGSKLLPTGAPSSLSETDQHTWVASHELAETITDPDGSTGWRDYNETLTRREDEIMDVTEDTLPTGQVASVYNGYMVEKIWSNFDNSSVVTPSAPTYQLRLQPNGLQGLAMQGDNHSWKLLDDQGVANNYVVAPDGANVYMLDRRGLYRYNARASAFVGPWSSQAGLLDNFAISQFKLSPDCNDLYILDTRGLYRYNIPKNSFIGPSSGQPGLLDNVTILNFYISPDNNDLYILDTRGLYRYNIPSNSFIGPNAARPGLLDDVGVKTVTFGLAPYIIYIQDSRGIFTYNALLNKFM